MRGSAYFGSWAHAYEIPEEQLQAIAACPFVWFSHGHPDHLNADSLDLGKTKQILLPDHTGQRIRRELGEAGFNIRVLPDRRWIRLSERIRVLCIADEAQNAVLLVDLDGRLLVNLNDAIDRGWGRFVRRIVRKFDDSVLLALTGYGDADMINLWGEDGRFIEPAAGAKRSFAVVREVGLISHRSPNSRFQRDFDRLEGSLCHLGNPEFASSDAGPFFAYEVLSEESRHADPR